MEKYAIISMDIEDWYHSHFATENVDRSISLLDGLDITRNILKKEGIRGSFFVVGELAESIKNILKEMDKEGHDIGAHNWLHLPPNSMSIEEFKSQLIKSKNTIEKVLNHNISGYRAPLFAIDDDRLKIVEKLGFKYDSSKLKPQKSSKYGKLNLSQFKEIYPCIYKKGNFIEFEVSTQKIGSMNMLLGGGYLRMLPWIFIKYMTKKYLKSGKPYVMYIHPIDLSKKSMPVVKNIGINRYLRTHLGRKTMEKRFIKTIKILKEEGYKFITFDELRKKVI